MSCKLPPDLNVFSSSKFDILWISSICAYTSLSHLVWERDYLSSRLPSNSLEWGLGSLNLAPAHYQTQLLQINLGDLEMRLQGLGTRYSPPPLFLPHILTQVSLIQIRSHSLMFRPHPLTKKSLVANDCFFWAEYSQQF